MYTSHPYLYIHFMYIKLQKCWVIKGFGTVIFYSALTSFSEYFVGISVVLNE